MDHGPPQRPGEYKLLFRYLKLFGLMAYIEGDADHGYRDIDDLQSVQAQPSLWAGTRKLPASAAARHALAFDSHPCAAQGASSTPQGARFTWRRAVGWSRTIPGDAVRQHLGTGFCGALGQDTDGWRLEREVDLIPYPAASWCPTFAWYIQMAAASCSKS